MSVGDPTGPNTQQPPPDTQTLIALLGSLMPLLLRIQAQGPLMMPPLPQMGQGPYGLGNPMLDQQAAVTFVEDITGDSLRRLSGYLEAHADKHPALRGCTPIVTQAAHCVAVRDYAQALELIWQAYRLIAALRAANPQLPPLRPAGESGTAAASSQGGSAEAARVH